MPAAEPDPRTLTPEVLKAAHDRVRPFVHRTPILTCRTLDRRVGTELFFKAECFQGVGAFKLRGACNAVFSLSPEELARGVVTHSSGNHAQAVARAAQLRQAAATLVMPRTAPQVKLAAVRGYGADVRLCEPTLEAREAAAAAVIDELGSALIHPFDDPRVIAGQATAAIELLEEVPGLDLLLAPVGGGGLLSGCALAAHHFSPGTEVLGAEPAAADDAYRSLESGRIEPSIAPQTVADGLLTSLGPWTFAVIRRLAGGIVTVDEAAIIDAMRTVWERMKVIIEPSAAVPVAALLAGRLETAGRRIGVILSGGNVDLDRLPWMR